MTPDDHIEAEAPRAAPPDKPATYWQALTVMFAAIWILLNQRYGHSDAHALKALAATWLYWASDRRW